MSETVFFEGFLFKQGHGSSSSKWPKRFVKIVPEKIYYANSASGLNEKQTIPLSTVTDFRPKDGLMTKTSVGLEIDTVGEKKKTRVYRFACETAEQRDTVIESLKKWKYGKTPESTTASSPAPATTTTPTLSTAASSANLTVTVPLAVKPAPKVVSESKSPLSSSPGSDSGTHSASSSFNTKKSPLNVQFKTQEQLADEENEEDEEDLSEQYEDDSKLLQDLEVKHIEEDEKTEDDSIAEDDEAKTESEDKEHPSSHSSFRKKDEEDTDDATTVVTNMTLNTLGQLPQFSEDEYQRKEYGKEKHKELNEIFNLDEEETAMEWNDNSDKVYVDLTKLKPFERDREDEKAYNSLIEMVKESENEKKPKRTAAKKTNATIEKKDDAFLFRRIRDTVLSKTKDSDIFFSCEVKVRKENQKKQLDLVSGIIGLGNKHVYIMAERETKWLPLLSVQYVLQNGYDHSILALIIPDATFSTSADIFDWVVFFEPSKHKTSLQRKLEFLDTFSPLYFELRNKAPTISFVDEVSSFARLTQKEKTEKKQVDVEKLKKSTIDPYDILHINSHRDFAQIYQYHQIINHVGSLGDRAILFTSAILKKKPRSRNYDSRYLVVTDAAMYFLSDRNSADVKRRIPHEEVGQIVKNHISKVDASGKLDYVIQVPAEYDYQIRIELKSENRNIAFEFEKTIESLFEDKDIIKEISASEVIYNFCSEVKTPEFKANRGKNKDSTMLCSSLANALQSEDPDKIRYNLQLLTSEVKKLRSTNPSLKLPEEDLLIEKAQTTLQQMKQQQVLLSLLEKSLAERDLPTIDEIRTYIQKQEIQKDPPIYGFLKKAVQDVEPTYNALLNEKILMKRLQNQIAQIEKGKLVEDDLFASVADATRAGFIQDVEEFKRLYSLALQKIYIRQEVVNNEDADSLILLRENARRLDIHKEDRFKSAKKAIPELIKRGQTMKDFSDAIEQARVNSSTAPLTSIIQQHEQKEKLSSFEWLSSLLKEARAEIDKVKLRMKIVSELDNKVSELEQKAKLPDVDESWLSEVSELVKKCEADEHIQKYKVHKNAIQRAHRVIQAVEDRIRKIQAQKAVDLKEAMRKALDDNNIALLKQQLAQAKQSFFANNSVLEFIRAEAEEIVREAELEQTVNIRFKELFENRSSLTVANLPEIEQLLMRAQRYLETNPQLSELRDQLEPTIIILRMQQQIILELSSAATALDQPRFEELKEKAKENGLADAVRQAESTWLVRKQLEKNLRDNIRESIKTNNVIALRQALEFAKTFPTLVPLVEQSTKRINAKDQLKQLIIDIEQLIESNGYDDLNSVYNLYEDILPNAMKKRVKEALNKMRGAQTTSEDFKVQLNSLIKRVNAIDFVIVSPAAIGNLQQVASKIVAELKEQLKLAPQYTKEDPSVGKIVDDAFAALRRIDRQYSIAVVRNLKRDMKEFDDDSDDDIAVDDDDFDDKHISLSATGDIEVFISALKKEITEQTPNKAKAASAKVLSSPLITKLNQAIRKLISSCEEVGVNPTTGLYTVEMVNPVGKNVVKAIADILSNNLRKKYFGAAAAKSPFDILSQIPDKIVQYHVANFNHLDLVQKLPNENKASNLSLLLIHYLLSVRDSNTSQDMMSQAIERLHANEKLVTDVYDPTAVMRDLKYRDDLYGVTTLFRQFEFKFQTQNQGDVLVDHPIYKLKGDVRAIVQYFVPTSAYKQQQSLNGNIDTEQLSQILKQLGDESAQNYSSEIKKNNIGALIRERLCPTLLTLLSHGLKSSRLTKTHVWLLIEEIAELRKISAVDLGGIRLPDAVDNINRLYNTRSSGRLKDAYDFKFRSFICQALNEKTLSLFIESIYNPRNIEVLKKYYDTNTSLVFQPWETDFTTQTVKSTIIGKILEYLVKLHRLPFNLRLDAEIY